MRPMRDRCAPSVAAQTHELVLVAPAHILQRVRRHHSSQHAPTPNAPATYVSCHPSKAPSPLCCSCRSSTPALEPPPPRRRPRAAGSIAPKRLTMRRNWRPTTHGCAEAATLLPWPAGRERFVAGGSAHVSPSQLPLSTLKLWPPPPHSTAAEVARLRRQRPQPGRDRSRVSRGESVAGARLCSRRRPRDGASSRVATPRAVRVRACPAASPPPVRQAWDVPG
jgi:hypothetical protein